MQPYFFPYIGYWQLLNAVDTYVIYDDVNFIKGGWINRNRILANGKPQNINVILDKPSSNKRINETKIKNDRHCYGKILKTLELSYRRAPQYDDVIQFLEPVLSFQADNLGDYLSNSIRAVCSYLEISTRILLSSEIEKDSELKAQDKVLDICTRLGATVYYNATGGKGLYEVAAFQEKGIGLKFLQTDAISYNQFKDEFVPNLSIIDVMMFNSTKTIKGMLEMFALL